jgi:hypothetical protein
MSLYRQPGRTNWRVVAAAAVVALLVGGVIGYAVRGPGDKTSLAEAVRSTQADLRPAVDGLDFLPTEYAQAVRGSGRSELRGVQATLRRVRASVVASRADLAVLNRLRAQKAEAELAELDAAVAGAAPPQHVRDLALAAEADIKGAAGIP